MSISIDKIDLIMERAQVGYAEARDVLTKFDGNVVESLIYLEGSAQTRNYHERKIRERAPRESIFTRMGKFLNRLHKTHFILSKNGSAVLDLPMTVTLILTVMTLPFSLFLMIIALVSGHRFTVRKPNGSKIRMKEAMQAVEKQRQKVRDAITIEESVE